MHWEKRFVLFHGKRHPLDMGAAEVEAFLSHLATDRDVAAATQFTPGASGETVTRPTVTGTFAMSMPLGSNALRRYTQTATRASGLTRHAPQTEMLSKRFEVTVAVQQFVVVYQAAGGNQRVDRLAHGHAQCA